MIWVASPRRSGSPAGPPGRSPAPGRYSADILVGEVQRAAQAVLHAGGVQCIGLIIGVDELVAVAVHALTKGITRKRT